MFRKYLAYDGSFQANSVPILKVKFISNFTPQWSSAQTTMDTVTPPRGFRRSKEAEVPVPVQHNGGLHEESWHHLRLHEEAVPRPHRRPLSRHGTQQENRQCKYSLFSFFSPSPNLLGIGATYRFLLHLSSYIKFIYLPFKFRGNLGDADPSHYLPPFLPFSGNCAFNGLIGTFISFCCHFSNLFWISVLSRRTGRYIGHQPNGRRSEMDCEPFFIKAHHSISQDHISFLQVNEHRVQVLVCTSLSLAPMAECKNDVFSSTSYKPKLV